MAKYPFESIEKKWQQRWGGKDLPRRETPLSSKKSAAMSWICPLSFGAGLHVDIPRLYRHRYYCRFLRMNGYNVSSHGLRPFACRRELRHPNRTIRK
jgi:leucyl-tRNA synthetase